MPKDLQESDCSDDLFNTQLQLAKAYKTIKKAQKSSFDLLSSIAQDAAFVERVSAAFNFPVACNERCGRWYVPPPILATSVYFKSTDGHTDCCKFSLRRLNLHILPFIEKRKGVIIVDSTSRGKVMPDALSKTLPIWMCVLNRAAARLFCKPWTVSQLQLQTSSKVVSKSEQDKISSQIDGWVDALIATGLDSSLLEPLSRPLKPMWLTPVSTLQYDSARHEDKSFFPVVLVTASRRVPDGVERQHGFTYTQGAADDTENGTLRGLTPQLFWNNQGSILESGLSCDEILSKILRENHNHVNGHQFSSVAKHSRVHNTAIYLADQISSTELEAGSIIDLCVSPSLTTSLPRYLHLTVLQNKRGLSDDIFRRIETFLSAGGLWRNPIYITDDDNCRSHAAVVALLLLTIYYDLDDRLREFRLEKIDKGLLQKRLVTLVNSREGVNPTRANLKSLNSYLMSGAYTPSRMPSIE